MRIRITLLVIAVIAVLAAGSYLGYVLKHNRGPLLTGPAIKVSFLDADLGGGTLVRTPEGKIILIDPGPERSAGNLVDYLKNTGAQSVQIVISNPAAERAGALRSLLEAFTVSMIYRGEKAPDSGVWRGATDAIRSKNVPETLLCAPNTVQLSASTRLEVLSPPKGLLGHVDNAADNNSVVTRICFGEKKILLTSDIRNAAEAYLVKSGADLRSDVLTIPRHGRWPLISLELLRETRPSICELSVARNTDRPNRALLSRIAVKNTGADVFRTDKYGTIDMVTDGRSIRIDTERTDND